MPECKFEDRAGLSQKVLDGVNKLADNVATTLGPKGRNVILHQKGRDPIITKDGVTVSQFVHLDDEFENAAAQIIKQATSQTNSMAGDGTTTATVLSRERPYSSLFTADVQCMFTTLVRVFTNIHGACVARHKRSIRHKLWTDRV